LAIEPSRMLAVICPPGVVHRLLEISGLLAALRLPRPRRPALGALTAARAALPG
jgi:hypothetical protein